MTGRTKVVVRCGLDELFRAEPATEGVTSNQLTLVGRLSPEKGHRVLLDAASRLQRDDVDFRIVLVGDGELAALGARARKRVLQTHDVRREASHLKELFERYAIKRP